jgi:hypothetical protein
MADKMRKLNLDALNEPRPRTMRYHAHYEVVMEFLNRAGAMLEFAGQLGLIDSEESGGILRSISPELTQWLEDEDKRLESDA